MLTIVRTPAAGHILFGEVLSHLIIAEVAGCLARIWIMRYFAQLKQLLVLCSGGRHGSAGGLVEAEILRTCALRAKKVILRGCLVLGANQGIDENDAQQLDRKCIHLPAGPLRPGNIVNVARDIATSVGFAGKNGSV
ncbi:hypothetical protein MPH_06298 [Macrophomina phaseolina MS6]|uniref:Uncharacterized protein n=1 Tax=Macrophomina phaseolina (strain MS6) TaxID=1126212 RepID=K2RUZ7_MACPH|nr:hypothetical protein MPH_06298 [Macrophomina phaseolina MS6]